MMVEEKEEISKENERKPVDSAKINEGINKRE